MKKLLLCFTFDVSLKDWSNKGFLTRELKYYEELSRKLNLEIHFLTYGDKDDFNFLSSNSSIKLIPIFENIKKSKSKILNLFKSIYFVYKFKNKFVLFDFYKSNQNYGSWMPILLKLKFKKKFISRGGYDLFHFSLCNKNILKIFISYFICTLAYRFADIIFVPTEFYKKFVNKFFFINKNIFVLPNYVDTKLFNLQKSNKYRNKILFVGRLVKQKNIFKIIKSLSNSQYELDILGDGPLKKNIINYSKKLNLKIYFLDGYSNEKMSSLYSQYDFLILFSKYEGNPKVILEAMSCGLCVIGSNTIGINNILNKDNGLLVDLVDHQSISFKLDNLSKSGKLKHIQKNARDYILDKHSIEKILEKEMYLLNQI